MVCRAEENVCRVLFEAQSRLFDYALLITSSHPNIVRISGPSRTGIIERESGATADYADGADLRSAVSKSKAEGAREFVVGKRGIARRTRARENLPRPGYGR